MKCASRIKNVYGRILSVCLWLAFISSARAQIEDQKNSIIEQRIEEIAATLDEGQELDYTNLFEDLSYFFEHPLNLNKATVDELRELQLLTDIQISNLQKHIARYGELRSVFELQAVADFDIPTIRNISWFVTVKPTLQLSNFSLKEFFDDSTHDLFLRYKRNLQLADGFIPDPTTGVPDYTGSPDYMYTRYRINYKKSFRAGMTMEKDAGESVQTGPDFYSAHAMYSGQTWLRKLIVGDYQVLLGQGLTCWNGLAFGKSPFITNVKRNGLGLRPYSSVQETNFFRGAAATVGFNDLEITAFHSNKHIDGNVDAAADSVLTDDEFIVSSLPAGGLHRTVTEIANKNQVRETVYGGNVKYTHRLFSIGATAIRTAIDAQLAPNLDLYNMHKLTASQNVNLGMDYQAVLGNANFFGEAARSQNGGFSTINGFVAAVHPRLTITAVHRWFGKDYQNTKANVFGENNLTAANEHGLYTGMQVSLGSKYTVTTYADIVAYPWLRYRVDAPSLAKDYLIQLNFKPDKKNEIYLRYRRRQNFVNSALDQSYITSPGPTLQENWRINASYQAHPNIQMRTRAEWSIYTTETGQSRGFVIYQDVNYKRLGSKATFSLRYAIMDSPSWTSRIYAYENDVLYAFSILPYYGKGSRIYGMVKIDIARGIDLWARYGAFLYDQTRVITDASGTTTDHVKSDVHIQLRFQF